MGGCAGKPTVLEAEQVPVESPAPVDEPVVTEKALTVPQEDGVETKKEEPLVDVSEPVAEAPKTEETTTVVTEESVPVAESKRTVEEVKEQPKEVVVAETTATPVVEEIKNDAPEVKA